MNRNETVLAVVLFSALPALAGAQGEIAGRVIAADSARSPLRGVEVFIGQLRLSAITDSSGRFRMKDVPVGVYTAVIRAVGFRAESSTVEVLRDEVLSLEVKLAQSAATALPERVVTAPGEPLPARLAEFVERQKAGIGHFINRDQLAKAEGGQRQTGDLIAMIPGARAQRGGSKIWISSARANTEGKCVFCRMSPLQLDRADFLAGARPACYMDVYLDGKLVFDSTHPENGLFDVNTLQPAYLAGIEVYSSAAQIPAKYNRTGGGCGVLLIWTR